MARFNRTDICEAYIAYGALYHGGQGTAEYRDMCRAKHILDTSFVEPYQLSENAREIYLALGGDERDFNSPDDLGPAGRALMSFLGCSPADIEECAEDCYGEGQGFEIEGHGTYVVMTDEERDDAVSAARDIRLEGDEDAMLSPYDGAVYEENVDGERLYIVRVD